MQAIVDACEDGRLDAEVCVLISNNSRSMALERAHKHGIPAFHLSSVTHPDPDDLDRAILATLTDHRVEVIVLGGYMKRLGPLVLTQYRGHILNTHPALLPNFGGKGMYGDNTHAAVLASGQKISGATVHLVEGDYDTGPTLSQVKVPVLDGDTIETLRDRVQAAERKHYVAVLQKIAAGDIRLEGLADFPRKQTLYERERPE
jgi:phosphoribosylglycinamide formyltransferase-1